LDGLIEKVITKKRVIRSCGRDTWFAQVTQLGMIQNKATTGFSSFKAAFCLFAWTA
jgi:hypothetical protein